MAIIIVRDNQQQLNNYRNFSNTTWLVSVALCFGLIGLGLVAAVIVLSLIPVYLSTKNINANNKLINPFNVTYRSDMINGSSLTIVETKTLSTSLGNALHLNSITNLNGQFLPLQSNTASRKKRAEDHFIRTRRSTDGDLFNIQFSLEPRNYCLTENCRNKVTNEAKFHIGTQYTTFSLLITFSNGRKSQVNLSFCSFDSFVACQVDNSGNICSSDEIEDVCAGYDTICQNDTGLCQDGCTDVIDVCQGYNS